MNLLDAILVSRNFQVNIPPTTTLVRKVKHMLFSSNAPTISSTGLRKSYVTALKMRLLETEGLGEVPVETKDQDPN